jgi:2-dehydro-3-deoxygalactonokinase
MDWQKGYLAIDWGTTNRRLYAIGRGGAVEEAREDSKGILAVPPGRFEAEIEAIRAEFAGRPLLLAGMVGSDRGWREAPYVPCPAGAEALAASILWVEKDAVGIVPGLCQAPPEADVMRGEEVQAIGALAAERLPGDALVCHPGTHTKWIQLADGRVASFRTMMTGEIFSLLKAHSILAPQLGAPVAEDESFRDGVGRGLAGAEPLSALFAIRARHLLGAGDANGASHASGLLIGADVRAGLARHRGGPVGLVGRSDLRALYAAAIGAAGHDVIEVDGAEAFLAGIHRLTECLG